MKDEMENMEIPNRPMRPANNRQAYGEPMSDEPAFDLRERTKAFALRIVGGFTALPKTEVARVLGKQFLRSGTSVGANYREAYRSRSKQEFVAKLGDCLKELDETSYWLELLDETRLMPSSAAASLLDECHQLIAILTAITKKTKKSMKEEGGKRNYEA